MKKVNFDANASYGLIPAVEGILKQEGIEQLCFNPSSIHSGGQGSRACVEAARAELMQFLNLDNGDFRCVFTSGATEANNFAVEYAAALQSAGNSAGAHYIATAIEHPSVLQPLRRREEYGEAVSFIQPDSSGAFCLDYFVDALRPETKLVSVMLANNETGQILPVQEVFTAIRALRPDIVLHTDAVQAVGKLRIDYGAIGADILTISGHKIGALSGVGAAIVRESLPIRAQLTGGAQELRWRSGTENVLGIYSFGVASRVLRDEIDERIGRMRATREKVSDAICATFPDIRVVSEMFDSIENTLCILLPEGISSDVVVAADLEGVLISSGSACSSGKPLSSHVLLAMGFSEAEAGRALRISFRHDYTEEEIDSGIKALRAVLSRFLSSNHPGQNQSEGGMY